MYTQLHGAMQAQQVDECVRVSLNTSLPYQLVNHVRYMGVEESPPTAPQPSWAVGARTQPTLATNLHKAAVWPTADQTHTTTYHRGWEQLAKGLLTETLHSVRLRALNRRPARCVARYKALNSLHFLSGQGLLIEDMRTSEWRNAGIPLSTQIIVKMRLLHLFFLLSLQLMLFALPLVLTCYGAS